MKDFFTKEKLIGKYAVTTDNKYISFDLYDKSCNILKKGALSSGEVVYALSLENSFFQTYEKMSKRIRDISVLKNISIRESVSKMLEIENSLCVEKLKKTASCLTKNEHIDIMKELLEKTKDLTTEQTLHDTRQEVDRYYLKNRHHLDYV